MIQSTTVFMHSPGNENEGGNLTANNDDYKKTGNEQYSQTKEENNQKKPFLKKIREALQEWSNNDQREQEIDDRRP